MTSTKYIGMDVHTESISIAVRNSPFLLRLLLENRFRESGYRVRKIVICDNCFGTGIAWCRCARGS